MTKGIHESELEKPWSALDHASLTAQLNQPEKIEIVFQPLCLFQDAGPDDYIRNLIKQVSPWLPTDFLRIA